MDNEDGGGGVVLWDTGGDVNTTLLEEELLEGKLLLLFTLFLPLLLPLVVPSKSDNRSFNPVFESHLAMGLAALVSSEGSILTNCPTAIVDTAGPAAFCTSPSYANLAKCFLYSCATLVKYFLSVYII